MVVKKEKKNEEVEKGLAMIELKTQEDRKNTSGGPHYMIIKLNGGSA